MPRSDPDGERLLDPHVPRVLLRHLAETPEATVRTVEATILLADVSGFTKLSERLARRGREGAEELVEAIGGCFGPLLDLAYEDGGSLLKLGGDALLLLFEGDDHLPRACRTAAGMRRLLLDVGRLRTSVGNVVLRMSQGIHSGELHLFLVGESHRELLVAGPGATAVTRMEKAAGAGEIVLSPQTAQQLLPSCRGALRGEGRLLLSLPPAPPPAPPPAVPHPGLEAVASCLSTEVRAHARSGRLPPEHRQVTVAFVRFEGADALIEGEGPQAAADELGALVADVQRALDEREVCFLESDVDVDGGKLMLTAGAPRMVGDDTERMLLALRRIADGRRRLGVRIGVNRGNAFCGDVGTPFRRSYSVMGDTVNLAARITAKAPVGEVYATAAALEASAGALAATPLEPLTVKGKAQPVPVWSLGPARGKRTPVAEERRLPFVGREAELALLDEALASARGRRGRLVEISGEAASARRASWRSCTGAPRGWRGSRSFATPTPAPSRTRPGASCCARSSAPAGRTPPSSWSSACACASPATDPALLPWLPLLALPLGIDPDPTPEVEALAPVFATAQLHRVTAELLRVLLPEAFLLEVEDVHLMDAASADLLAAVTAELSHRPWLAVATRRDAEGGFSTPDAPHVIRLELDGLAPDEALLLAETATEHDPPPPHLVALAAERSGGNPQFLRDLLQAVTAGGEGDLPDSIETAAMARIDRLAPADRNVVRRAAVLGLRFEERHLPGVLDVGVPVPDAATWRRLHPLIAPAGDGAWRFTRAVVRDAAYAGLPFSTRRQLHVIVAALLEREAGDEPGDAAELLSRHYALAGDHAGTWIHARVAGDRARAGLAFADAATSYRRAIRAGQALGATERELSAAWEALAGALTRTGELAEADEALRAARRLSPSDSRRQAALFLQHARIAERAGRAPSAVRWAQRGLRALDGLGDPLAARVRAPLLSLLAGARQREGRMDDAITLCHQAIAEAQAAGEDAALAQACHILDWALFDAGRAAEATHSDRALEIYERLGDLDRQAAVLNNMGGFAYHEGRWQEAVELYRRAADASARAGDVANAAFGDCNVGEVLGDQGHLAQAEQRLRRALRVWRGSSYDWGAAFATALLGRTAVRAGRHAEGLELLEDALARFRRLRAGSDALLVRAYVAEALAFGRRPQRALQAADRLLPDAGRSAALVHRVRGFALAQLGDGDGAERALRASVDAARAQDSHYELAVSMDALLALRTGSGRGAGATAGARRDALLARLDVVALPAPPLQLTPAAAAG
jgi:class 3 adenylate cyclase/tetratricopeptide (TPR) repeat protein